jgi:hypothetical protein
MSKEEVASWRCANRNCDWFMVATPVDKGETAPKCTCGSAMKQVELVPVLGYLDFLREEFAKQEVALAQVERE